MLNRIPEGIRMVLADPMDSPQDRWEYPPPVPSPDQYDFYRRYGRWPTAGEA